MLRIVFDTNIYGNLIKESNLQEIEEQITKSTKCVVYGFNPIRKELRNISKKTKESRKLRLALLNLYDNITQGRNLQDASEINDLTIKYHEYYRNLGGTYGFETNIQVDFMIVACASYNNLDIICTGDKKTLRNTKAEKAYLKMNTQKGLKTPLFLSYEDLLIITLGFF